MRRIIRWASFVALLAAASPGTWPQGSVRRVLHPRPPDQYVIEFVSSAATGVDMNDSGTVAGTSYLDPGCGSFCLPPLETVVWRGSERIVLPSVPGFTGIHVRSINAQGWVAGFAGFPGTTTRAVVWRPSGNGSGYVAVDLGTLPGTTASEAVAIDDQGRVVGWSTTLDFLPSSAPFLWSEPTGMVDLSALGYPDEKPLAMSSGGSVATVDAWYRLGDPGSVVPMPAPPSGFALGAEPTAINDAGDQARFLIRTSGQNLRYLYRFHHEGSWQQISATPTGHLTRYGIGSIDDARSVTATVAGTGVVARGPEGLAQPLAALLSPAYPGTQVVGGGPQNRRGEILAEALIGASTRLVRLVRPRAPSFASLRVNDLAISADFVPDPGDATGDHCSPDLTAHDEALVTLTVTTPSGAPEEGALVSGRFLDAYWTNQPVSAVTNANGVVSFSYIGPCGVGALTFFLDDARSDTRRLDETTGVLTVSAVPQ